MNVREIDVDSCNRSELGWGAREICLYNHRASPPTDTSALSYNHRASPPTDTPTLLPPLSNLLDLKSCRCICWSHHGTDLSLLSPLFVVYMHRIWRWIHMKTMATEQQRRCHLLHLYPKTWSLNNSSTSLKKVMQVAMARHGLATKDQKVQLLTNHFKVNVSNVDGYFFHYSVALFYEDSRPMDGIGVGRKVLAEFTKHMIAS